MKTFPECPVSCRVGISTIISSDKLNNSTPAVVKPCLKIDIGVFKDLKEGTSDPTFLLFNEAREFFVTDSTFLLLTKVALLSEICVDVIIPSLKVLLVVNLLPDET